MSTTESATSSPGFFARIYIFWRALRPISRTRVRFGFTGFVVGFLIAVSLFTKACQVKVPPIQVVKSSSGVVHPAISGRPVLVKAALEPRPGRVLSYSWDFGDDSEPVTGVVADPYAVSANHLYEDTEVGDKFTAVLTITDIESGDKAVGEYPIKFVKPTTKNKEAIALDDGLWNLHTTIKRSNDPSKGEMGVWNPAQNPLGSTAMAALAFEVNGFDGRSERRDTPYAETVDRALSYILSGLTVLKLEGDLAKFDTNENGVGLYVAGGTGLYEQPLITMALVASQTPKRIAHSGPEGVIGKTYREIVVDLLEFLGHAQIDEGNTGRGGWRYTVADTTADMSVTQWPVLAFMAAEEVWDIEIPTFVREELKHCLKTMQGENGGFDYTPNYGGINNGLTGAGIIAHAFAGTSPKDPAVKKARDYIATNWDGTNIGSYYTMYAVMKGSKLTDKGIEKYGDHDWHTEYVDHLFATQNPNGSWNNDGDRSFGALSTAWPSLILSQDIFAKGSPLSLVWKVAITIGILIIIVLIVLVVLYLLKRRGGGSPLQDAEILSEESDTPAPSESPAPSKDTGPEGC